MGVTMRNALVLVLLCVLGGCLSAADSWTTEITNGEITVRLYLPDAKDGFYRATRFDWSGVIYSLQYRGHEYYGRWFQSTDPAVHDFVYKGADIVASPCTSMTGPADEFAPLGWDEAKKGGTFVKIGVGVLRKADEGKYDNFHLYDIVDPGNWAIKRNRESLEFKQEVKDPSSGYGYVYQKTVRLVGGKPEMVLEHRLQNTGTHAIRTKVYNHNFLTLDGQPTGTGLVITVPFQIQTKQPPEKRLAEIRGNRIVYLKTLENGDVAATSLEGFSDSPKDNQIRIENERLGVGMSISADRPLLSEALWSIRAVMAMEPFVSVTIEPGQEFTWSSTYSYYTVAARAK